MASVPGICTACKEIIVMKSKTPFLACPHCKEVVSGHETITELELACMNPENTQDIISMCLDLEKTYSSTEIPVQILELLCSHHPHNEEAAWLVVRMSDFNPIKIKHYLSLFAGTKKVVPWAEDFLKDAMRYKNMEWAGLFENYIDNKLPVKKQGEYRQKLGELRTAYAGRAQRGEGIKLMYVYYVVCSIVNVALFFVFFFTRWALYFYVLMAIGAFAIEIILLFLHNRRYGNRIGMSDRERLLLVIFICTIVVVIGGVFIGAAVKI